MSQTTVLARQAVFETSFSIGICAADSAANLQDLLLLIKSEQYPVGFILMKVVVVASGCDPRPIERAREIASIDPRFLIVEDSIRKGKFAAINQIIDDFDGDLLVLVNSDARPLQGAISTLLQEITKDRNVGVVSASPVVSGGKGMTNSVLQLMWGVHNECLSRLSDIEINNHCCDELIVIRKEALRKLPPGTVNDGAYLAGAAYHAGYSTKFCRAAEVEIDVPLSFADVVRQRRRIVYGHVQIWKSVGRSPRTLESMLPGNPLLSLSILIETLAKSPGLILALPLAIIGEAASIVMAFYDNLSSDKKHTTWERFGSRS